MPTVYRFGPFRLDAEAQLLFRGAEPMALGQRAVALLRVLVERAGAPVPKDALIEAAWPGLAVEESNLTVQIAALRRVFEAEPGGDLWIQTLSRRGYRFVGPVPAPAENELGTGTTSEPAPASALALPDLPSIAVLPFDNLSGDPEQEYFADGIVEEIITALSRFRHLFVIARNSSFVYKGKPVDVKRVGRDLGVRYVLEGSVRKAANQVRIAAQLIDASTGKHLWAERFDGALQDIFDLQDQVAASVVGAIAPTMEQAEIERARLKPTESLDAYDFYLRGLASIHQATRDANSEALRLFYEAIKLDPDFAHAHGMAAWCYAWRTLNGWMSDRDAETAEASRLARRAKRLGKGDALALVMAGYALAHVVGDVKGAAAFADEALALNPNLAAAWLLSGWVQISLGEPEIAINRIEHSIRLSPLDPLTFVAYSLIGLCHFLADRDEEAMSWDEKSLRERPDWVPSLRRVAATHAMAGRMPQAKKTVERMLEINPAMRVSELGKTAPLLGNRLAKLMEGLRKAGVPE
jgi:TolB-like protein/Tfp pilus assembly protein PilF